MKSLYSPHRLHAFNSQGPLQTPHTLSRLRRSHAASRKTHVRTTCSSLDLFPAPQIEGAEPQVRDESPLRYKVGQEIINEYKYSLAFACKKTPSLDTTQFSRPTSILRTREYKPYAKHCSTDFPLSPNILERLNRPVFRILRHLPNRSCKSRKRSVVTLRSAVDKALNGV